MSKKLVFTIGLVIVSIFTLATTFSFATDGQNPVNTVVDGARNAVNGAENAVEGAVNDIGDTLKDSGNKTGNTMNNVGNTVNNASRTNTNTNYTAGRTATTGTAGTNTFLGMNSTAWTWVVLAIAAVAIIGLVWYYSTKTTNSRSYHDGE